ncbi:cytochrome c family protein [Bradyrhizobium sp. CCGUVB23]|uniref:c-type cytochrome n=1 Tax=Bradyrhizobium sp. CCGUVB23 TaxID=2949630 RepID=UPI0020B2C1F5|nr:c-type cytochrome [Bradyrhizobium sp. CCGUVB23]MCP3466096.1 c-type cytochrome [Bradyrhizobium sp. CCGUVB23]
MWEQIRAVWRASSVFIVGLAVIFGGIYLVGRLSSSTNPPPAAAPTSDQAASSDQGRNRGQPAVASTETPSPQGGSAKQPAQQLAQSGKAPAQSPADQNNPAPTAKPTANAAASSPAVAASPSAHDHMAADTLSPGAAPPLPASPSPPAPDHMAQGNRPQASATTGQSPAAPASNAATAASNAVRGIGDATAGRLVFRKCQACHSTEPGKNMLGPSLAGVIGRKAGSEAGYNYSPAMKSADIVWSAQTLDQYLTDPAKVVPGNKMPFPGLKTDHDRADVIAYLAGCGVAHATAGPDTGGASRTRSLRHLHSRRSIHLAFGDRGRADGLYRRGRRDRRQGQSGPDRG